MTTTHRAEARESELAALTAGIEEALASNCDGITAFVPVELLHGLLHELAARATPPTEPVAAPFSQQRVAHLVGRLRDSSGGHINGLYDREAADMLEELAQLADSEGSRAVKYLRRARDAEARIAALEAPPTEPATPIDMVLHCPNCGMQHIDAPWTPKSPLTNDQINGVEPVWGNPPHRSHLCHGCGHIWRPADVPTNGVAGVKTKGKADSPVTARIAALEASETEPMLVADVARELGVSAVAVCSKLREAGFGNFSVNMAITRAAAKCVRAAFQRAALEAAAVHLSDETVNAAAEAAYWQFDARRMGYAEWKGAPQSERDAFKAEARKLARGAFPTKVDGT